MRTGLGRQQSIIPRREDLQFNLNSFRLERLAGREVMLRKGILFPAPLCRMSAAARRLVESTMQSPEVR